MQGKRVYLNKEEYLDLSEPGTYGVDKDGLWWCHPPKGGAGALDRHHVTEHADGTITVLPSIFLPGIWHGYLKQGVWQSC